MYSNLTPVIFYVINQEIRPARKAFVEQSVLRLQAVDKPSNLIFIEIGKV